MFPQEAIAVLAQGLPLDQYDKQATQKTLAELAKHLGYWPLLLTVARGLLDTESRYGRPLAQTIEAVMEVYRGKHGVTIQAEESQGFQETIESSLKASFRQLEETMLAHYQPVERYQELAIFPEGTDIPLQELRLLWQETAGLKPWETDDLCMQLSGFSLLLNCDMVAGTIRLHDVTRTYLLQRAGTSLPALHGHFLDTVRQGLQLNRWSEVPYDNAYLWTFLVWHLCQATRWEELDEALTDPRFLAAKALVQGVTSLEADLTLACIVSASWQQEHTPLPMMASWPRLQRRVGQISHLLQQVGTLSELGGLILAHLGGEKVLSSYALPAETMFTPPLFAFWHALPQPASDELIRTFSGHTSEVTVCAISPDTRFFLSGSSDNTLKTWDSATGHCLSTLFGHTGGITDCAISPDTRFLLSASWDNTLKIWDPTTGRCLNTFSGHTGGINACVISPNGRFILSASSDNTLKTWDSATGSYLQNLSGHASWITDCTISPDTRFILSASSDPTLRIWDSTTGRCLLTLSGHSGGVNACAISPDARFLLSASSDNTLKIWNPTTGRCLHTLSGHTSRITACAISPDTRFILSTSSDGVLKMWNSTTGYCLLTISGHADRVTACAISPDARFFLSSSYDQTLKLWDLTTGHCLSTFFDHTNRVTTCAISPNGRFILSASSDNTLKLWDSQTGRCLLTFPTDGDLTCCAFHPDGRHVVAGGTQGLLFLRLIL